MDGARLLLLKYARASKRAVKTVSLSTGPSNTRPQTSTDDPDRGCHPPDAADVTRRRQPSSEAAVSFVSVLSVLSSSFYCGFLVFLRQRRKIFIPGRLDAVGRLQLLLDAAFLVSPVSLCLLLDAAFPRRQPRRLFILQLLLARCPPLAAVLAISCFPFS